MLDDATEYDVKHMPITRTRIARQGTTFTRTYSPFPVCCPARATILTGQYPHNHGVLDNVAPQGGYTTFDDSRTVATYLDDDYRTGLFGKYLNDNGSQRRYIPPGWDSYTIPAAGQTYRFIGADARVDGRRTSFPHRLQTAVLSRQTRGFMSASVAAGDPFFAFLSFVAPHHGIPRGEYPSEPGRTTWVPPKYRHTAHRVLPHDRSVNEKNVGDKPAFIRHLPRLTPNEMADNAERSAQRVEAVHAVDREIGRTIHKLRELGVLHSTYLIVTSDNGLMLGQHRLTFDKSVAYEPVAHVPLIIRGPGLKPGSVYHRVSGLQDITPTILAMTGQTNDQPTDVIDGVDLLGQATGERPRTGRAQLIEIPVTAGLSDVAVQLGARPSPAKLRALTTLHWRIRGIVTNAGFKYVRRVRTGEVELYNLNTDPFELQNLANSGHQDRRLARMAARLRTLRNCAGTACR